jgi:hypothetical protein
MEENRREEKRKNVREEEGREQKKITRASHLIQLQTIMIFVWVGAGRLMRGRGCFGLATYKEGNRKEEENKRREEKRREEKGREQKRKKNGDGLAPFLNLKKCRYLWRWAPGG